MDICCINAMNRGAADANNRGKVQVTQDITICLNVHPNQLTSDSRLHLQQHSQHQHLLRPCRQINDHMTIYLKNQYVLRCNHCKIKSSGEYKIRYVALGNFDDYDGVTFSPTAAKKVIWLVFAITVLLHLLQRFLDVKGAFMTERPKRDIYVSLDGNIYLLKYNLYGLKDAAKVFNDRLNQHLIDGGYTQSKWDLCLFYKWVSAVSFIIIVFHVDDFSVNSSDEQLLNEFEQHMLSKYEVTSNTYGVF